MSGGHPGRILGAGLNTANRPGGHIRISIRITLAVVAAVAAGVAIAYAAVSQTIALGRMDHSDLFGGPATVFMRTLTFAPQEVLGSVALARINLQIGEGSCGPSAG